MPGVNSCSVSGSVRCTEYGGGLLVPIRMMYFAWFGDFG